MSDYVPTIDDIRVKMCYICREEESFDEPEDPPRAWTHPCKCTLIAHESCLAFLDRNGSSKTFWPRCVTVPPRSVWRMLTETNIVVGYLGKVVLVAVPITIASVVMAGTYWILTKYGAYAVHEFFGKEVYDTFLTSDMSKYGYLLMVSALLEWPSIYDRSLQSRAVVEWNAKSLYPPSPYTIGFILLPITRILYNKALKRVTDWVLGARIPIVDGEEENALMVVRVRGGGGDANAANENAGQQAANANAQPAPGEPALDEPVAEHNPADQTITIYASPLGRKLAGALLVPMIARHMGNFLLRLACKEGTFARYLRQILAIAPKATPNRWWEPSSLGSRSSGSSVSSIGVGSYRWSLDKNGFGSDVAWKDVLRALWGGSRVWAEFDPVWWRNTLGFGLFVVAKDALNLLHLWLIKRERETRKIKNRDFAGVDISGLDLINRSTS
ncbi:hypothetical protein BT96DRAFT_1016972 [Gymnopus androsaceus JB14]|uniref:RING-CH-type domain-containing protein n=1 Tax=Gymnopus androsaceus JB14 TaxID=1447944 RepID=A0A6A4I3N7_9AGAR|nr:hypothetical protein BT96DRAFT_1016972 [Gymnopus androsaceus JB14]